MKLQLGAGNRPRQGYLNSDIINLPGIDVVHDLNVLPWPWANEQFSEILSLSVFEHLRIRLDQSIQECWRILEPGGLLICKVPDHKSPTVADDPQHIHRGWGKRVFEFFDPTKGTYGNRGRMYGYDPWQIISVKAVAKGRSWLARMRKAGK